MSLKGRLRDGVARALSVTTLSAPRRRAAGRLTIATFHRVLPADLRARYPYYGLCVTPEELDFFCTYFRQRYTCGTLAESFRRFAAGDWEGAPLLAITFDDGQHDNVAYALPILRRHGLQASFYLPAALVEQEQRIWHDRLGFALQALGERPAAIAERAEDTKKLAAETREETVVAFEQRARTPLPEWTRLMRWDEARALVHEGHEVGSHSLHHPLLPQCSDSELRQELEGSKALLEEKLQSPVETFCYPNGDADARVAAATAAAGYRCAVTTVPGTNGLTTDPYRLRRFDIHPTHSRASHGLLSAARLQMRLSAR